MSGELILIVDDNDKNLKLARDVLQYHGFRTLEASTGRQGIDLARENDPDVVLLDIQLPDIDGVTALQELRASEKAAETPVVALTAFAMKADRQRFLDLDLDQIGEVLGCFPRGRDDRGDRLADETHHLRRQHRLDDRHVVELVQHRPQRLHRREVGGGDDHSPFRLDDADDAPRRHRAPDEAHPQRGGEVAGEPPQAGHQHVILDPTEGAAAIS